ncbi:MAG: extracellular solute-binding protein, partial [Firmicutes bacterium]|nr:extracellular solute-binding protein [Bacillota bacterium]
DEVIKPFQSSILVPLTYNDGKHKGIYGLPETQNFPVLFYRSDVMEEMVLPIPQTWDEMIAYPLFFSAKDPCPALP